MREIEVYIKIWRSLHPHMYVLAWLTFRKLRIIIFMSTTASMDTELMIESDGSREA